MPQGGYGRKVGAQSDYGATERSYQYAPKAAEEYLSGESLDAYKKNKQAAFTPFQAGQGWRASMPQIDARLASFGKMERLRDVASMKALGQFTEQAGQLSKPWLMQAPGGFLTEENVDRVEPEQTAHPRYMGDPEDPYTYAGVRKELTTRQMDPDEGFSLLKDPNDRRLRLKSYLEQMRMGLGAPDSQYNPDWGQEEQDYAEGKGY